MEHCLIDDVARVILSGCTDDCTPENCPGMFLVYGLMAAEECTVAQLGHDHIDPVGQG